MDRVFGHVHRRLEVRLPTKQPFYAWSRLRGSREPSALSVQAARRFGKPLYSDLLKNEAAFGSEPNGLRSINPSRTPTILLEPGENGSSSPLGAPF